jgi:hypothetical protein
MFSVSRFTKRISAESWARRDRNVDGSRSGRQRGQSRHAQEVVGTRCAVGVELRALEADEPTLSHAGHGLEPAEDLLDAFAMTLTDPVARVTRGSSVQARRDAPLYARDVRARGN